MLTRRQSDLLRFIAEYTAREGFGPSFSEMAAGIRVKSKAQVHRLIGGLEERGFIRRLRHHARAIEVIHRPAPSNGKWWELVAQTKGGPND